MEEAIVKAKEDQRESEENFRNENGNSIYSLHTKIEFGLIILVTPNFLNCNLVPDLF
jgi:hypothetical protein